MDKAFATTASKVAKESTEEIEDPLESMLNKTGCLEKHYSVQECIAETKDWRKCQHVVAEFKECMAEYQKRKNNQKR